MSAFSPTQVAEFRELLSRRAEQLLAEIRTKLAEARSERVAPDAVAATDGGDKALLDVASDIDLAMVRRDVEELREIERAQARLADGSFGVCSDCGTAIAAERLRAYPGATRCTACQNDEERRSGGAHGAKL